MREDAHVQTNQRMIKQSPSVLPAAKVQAKNPLESSSMLVDFAVSLILCL